MARTRKVLIVLAVVAAAGAAAWFKFGSDSARPQKKAGVPSAVPVVLATAEARDMPLLLEVTGRAEAYETVTLKARADGQVRAVVFAEGQRVRQGDTLLQLDPADFQARLAQAEANAARSQAQLTKARADAERATALKARGFYSDEKLGEARTALAAAEAGARADAAAADLARLQLSYTTIKAPFDGIVGAKLVFPGATVKTNDTALAVVNRVRPLHVSFAVPEKYLPQLRAGLRGTPQARKATVSVPGSQSGPIDAELRFMDNAVDGSTGTILMKAVLPNADEQIAPGQLVAVSITLDLLKDAVVVPVEAVQQGADGAFVFVVKDEAAEVRKVSVAATQKKLAAIGTGLAAGETVVVEGQLRLTPGAKVKPAGKPAGKPDTDKLGAGKTPGV